MPSETSTQTFSPISIYILIVLVCIGVIIFGVFVYEPPAERVESVIKSKKYNFNLKLIEEWKEVDPYLNDCRNMGAILREIERTEGYNVRLAVVIPQTEDDGLIVVNDGGKCWIDGDEKREKLNDPKWYLEMFEKGSMPDRAPTEPYSGSAGTWTITPIRDSGLFIWGALLIEKPKR